MKKLDAKVSKHAKDIIQKYANSLFKDATLEFYGLKTAKIKELIYAELPMMEVAGSSSDIIFLLEDDTYLHFEFQTTYSKNDLIRFAGYDLRLYARDGRTVITVVIYASDVKEASTELNVGSLSYNPDKILMADYNGNAIYAELDEKIKTEQSLADVDMLNLIFLPLMNNTISRKEVAVNSIKLAQTIPDTTKRDACIASAFAFASKYLNEDETRKLLEVLRMTDLAVLLVEDAIEDAMKVTAKSSLKEGLSIEIIKRITGLDETTIKQLQVEISNE